jgi:hypothetical protein
MRKLKLPDDLTLVPLPYLSGTECGGKHLAILDLRQTDLSNRLFENYTAILNPCQFAWRSLLIERINSIASRDWDATG